MNSLSNWLNKHKYKLLSDVLFKDKILRIGELGSDSKKLLKVLSLSELDEKVVVEAINRMNEINNMNISGLMKYKIIEKDDSRLYRIMREYKTHLDEINPLKYFEDIGIFDVLNGILNVLLSLSENGFIDSDLKPSNIFLNDENEVIMSDYLNNLLFKGRESKGFIKKEDLCFVCIDELIGKEIDISSDIWNFGLIFYYLKSGKYPFVGSNISKTILNILNINFIRLDCDSASELNRFLRKILCKEKKDRLKLTEIIDELEILNEPELPVIPFEEEEMKICEEMKTKINYKIDKYLNENENELDFYDFKMGYSGMKYLCSRLNTMNNVTNINIGNDLSSIGLNIFSKCLKFFPNLEGLYLHYNPIGNDSLKILSGNLHFIPELKKLRLTGCGLGDNDMKYLSSHFKDISNLESLSIARNNGVKYLCENINELAKLKELYVNYNVISDIGEETLLKNLPKCKELEVLWSYDNKISNYDDFTRRMKEIHPNNSLDIW